MQGSDIIIDEDVLDPKTLDDVCLLLEELNEKIISVNDNITQLQSNLIGDTQVIIYFLGAFFIFALLIMAYKLLNHLIII